MKNKLKKECPICNSKDFSRRKNYYKKNQLIYCKICDFTFSEKIPTNEELENYYRKIYEAVLDSEQEYYDTDLNRQSYSILLDEFEKFRKTNKIIDVGCGFGSFLKQAKARGWECYGTEFSKNSVDYCKKIGLDNIINADLNSKDFKDDEFDVITSFEVIEHLTDINFQLKEMKNILRSGGLLYITTPNFNSLNRYIEKNSWSVIHYPAHLSYFTKNSLNQTLKKNGFGCYKFFSTGIMFGGGLKFKDNEDKVVAIDNDYKIRKLSSGPISLILKNVVNFFLSITNTGATLKGYYLKSHHN